MLVATQISGLSQGGVALLSSDQVSALAQSADLGGDQHAKRRRRQLGDLIGGQRGDRGP